MIYVQNMCQEPPVTQISNLEMMDRGVFCLWWGSFHPRDLHFETWLHYDIIYIQNVCQEPPVTQRSNLEMVDRGVFDGVPDILENFWFETWHYNKIIYILEQPISQRSNLEMVEKGVFDLYWAY